MTTYRARRRAARALVVGAIAVALIVGGAIGAVVVRGGGRLTPTRPPATQPRASGSSSTVITTPSLRVVSVTPVGGALDVAPTAKITVTFSVPLSARSPRPTLSPATQGLWSQHGAVFVFTPSEPFSPLTEVTLSIPGGVNGVSATDHGRLATTATEQFRIENGTILRLQQLLSVLDYSPLKFAPSVSPPGPSDTAAQIADLFNPPSGTFTWRDRGWPATLRALWQPGVDNVFTRGLVMSFQADHDLTPNGHVGPGLWTALIQAAAANSVNTGGYNYAFANKSAPETLLVFHDGHVVLRSPANTGIASSPTPDGTFPVYTRLRQQVMRGTNPSGQHYADLVQYIAYFHGNDAVHYMDRADYGIPQSLGCIELPIVDAARAWPYLAYGTLVTVVN